MSRTSLIIDCDPGVDDAIALFLAFAAPERLDILGITTVAGNVSARLTARNARILRQIARREDVPVIPGCERPMVRQAVEAGHFHGESGLGNLAIFEPAAGVAEGHAVDFIVETVMSRPQGGVSLAVTGPMTNLAMAMVREPRIISRLGQVVAMGGARREGGNITASAEFNIYADPHAAQVVASSGCELVMMGLDVTHQVRATPERIGRLRALDTASARAAAELLDFACEVEARLGTGGDPPQHDPCTIAYLIDPTLFTTVPCRLAVETGSELTLGHTAVEFRLEDPAAARVRWATDADADGIFDLLTRALAGRAAA
ncbi:MAG TPA: nucleoside hydrolase [Phenylobacterium sp.]|nr:nucleoside hydrolase [Phenylobacterium sp.]